MKILLLCDYYIPGFKAGGPIRTIANMVDRLGEIFEFKIVTSCYDLGEKIQYKNININTWYCVNKAKVLYLPLGIKGLNIFFSALKNTDYDLIYLNSFFSPKTIITLIMRRCYIIRNVPIVLAPRGELFSGALSLKSKKKTRYMWLAKQFGLYEKINWHASSSQEKEAILYWLNVGQRKPNKFMITVAPNLADYRALKINPITKKTKLIDSLSIIFISRVSKNKNLHGALHILQSVKSNVDFNIYGPTEDIEYWKECQKIIKQLPKNIVVTYHGVLPPEKIHDSLSQHHLLLFPTLGENFGHVILEALCAGCPVLISNRTPWKDLYAQGIGYDLPLEDVSEFHKTIELFVKMDQKEFDEWSKRAMTAGLSYLQNDTIVDQNRKLFEQAVNFE